MSMSAVKFNYLARLCGLDEKLTGSVQAKKSLEELEREFGESGGRLALEDFTQPYNVDGTSREYFMAHKGFWDALPQLGPMLRAQGIVLTPDVMRASRPGLADDNFIKTAVKFKALDKLFTEAVFGDRLEDMQNLWYGIPTPDRRYIALKEVFAKELRAVAKNSGAGELPIDTLKRAGVEPFNLSGLWYWSAASSAEKMAEIKQKLEKIGEKFSKKYFLLLDDDGDTAFNQSDFLKTLPVLVKELAAVGERIEVEDFLTRANPERKTPLAESLRGNNHLHIITPEVWGDRLAEMVQLWSKINDNDAKEMVNLGFVLANAIEQTYVAKVVEGGMSREKFITPFTYQQVFDGSGKETRADIHPLLLAATWEKLRVYLEQAEKSGELAEKTTRLEDLRKIRDSQGNTAMLTAAKAGRFFTILTMIRATGEQLTAKDLTERNARGESVLDVLAAKSELALVFDPRLWRGRPLDVRYVFAAVPDDKKPTIDLQPLIQQARADALRDEFTPRAAWWSGKPEAPAAANENATSSTSALGSTAVQALRKRLGLK